MPGFSLSFFDRKNGGQNLKWFKHLVKSGDNSDIETAIELFGPAGYYVFFRTLEIMADEFSPDGNVFLWDVFRKKFRVSPAKLIKILQFFDEKNRIFLSFFNQNRKNYIRLKCPKLSTLADEYTRKKSGVSPDKVAHRKQITDNRLIKEHGPTTGPTDVVSKKNQKAISTIVINRLKEIGIPGNISSDYFNKNTLEFLVRKIHLFDFKISNGTPPENPVGWMRSAIEYDYDEPEGFHEWIKAERERILSDKNSSGIAIQFISI
jgi:hypothetical protein